MKADNRNKFWKRGDVQIQKKKKKKKKTRVPTSHLQNAEEALKQGRKQLKLFFKSLRITNGFYWTASKHLRCKNSLCQSIRTNKGKKIR